MEIDDIKKLLVEYKEVLNCKYSNSIFRDDNYESLEDKDKITLQLFEYIIDYLEHKELEQNGFYN